MSHEAAPFQSKSQSRSQSWSAPAKIFVAGEYLALEGLPSIVLALPPRFRLRRARAGEAAMQWPAASPAGLLRQDLSVGPSEAEAFVFEDPFGGSGGFGASSAQFALEWNASLPPLAKGEESFECWRRYRALLSESVAAETRIPSGADLIAQLRGGLGMFSVDPVRGPAYEDLSLALDSFHFVVFSAARKSGRKVATHEHLGGLGGDPRLRRGSALFESLSGCVSGIRDALLSGNGVELGNLLIEYAERLGSAGLENSESRSERERLSAIPGVLGAKGAGALLSDALLALVDTRDAAATSDILRNLTGEAESLGLSLVCDHVRREAGARSDD